MSAMTKNIKTVEKNSLNTEFNPEEFIYCFNELLKEDVLTILRNIFISLRAASDDECGVKHVTLEELRHTLDTMNSVFDDGIGVEKSFITQMAGSSNDLSAMIISPLLNSELWVVQLHDPGYMGKLGIRAINCSCMHESLEGENPYMVGVIVIDPINEDDVARQVLWHEVTHYVMSYIKSFVDRDTIACIDRIQNCNEFFADFLQFLAFKSSLLDGVYDFIRYEHTHIDERVRLKYEPFVRLAEAELNGTFENPS